MPCLWTRSPLGSGTEEVDWTTFSFPVSTGEHQLTWVYNKDASISEGEDTAYLDDVEVVPFQRYNPVHAPELDEALNVPGGTLEFYTPEEGGQWVLPLGGGGGRLRQVYQPRDRRCHFLFSSFDFYGLYNGGRQGG